MHVRILDSLDRFWKRRTDRPDYYQAYVNLPLDTDLPALASAVERACEGRADRVPQRDALVVETDFVPAEQFDAAAFERTVADLRERCPDRYAVHSSATWRRHEGGAAKALTVVPVKRLFPERRADAETPRVAP
jgi:hypothetical protein